MFVCMFYAPMPMSMPSYACMLEFVFFHAFTLTPTYLDVHSHAYMHIFMPICVDLCCHMLVCLDLCSLHAVCHLPCACALHAMFLCLNLGYVYHAICYCSHFFAFVFLSCVLAWWLGPDLDSMVFVTILTPRPTSKGLDHPICMFMFACFYALCLLWPL